MSTRNVNSYPNLVAGANTEPLRLNSVAGLAGAMSAASGGGAGFNGGVIALEGSMDEGVTWFDLRAVDGTPAQLTAAGYVEFSTAVPMIRVAPRAGIANVTVHLRVAL